ncbi:hypothetical protein ACHAXS_000633 [Conticribra weissflogii]
MFCPKLVHEQALKRIDHYLKAAADKGLIMKPSEKLLKMNSFPDADFAGMYRQEAMDDPVYVKNRTGYCNYGCQLFYHVAVQIAI